MPSSPIVQVLISGGFAHSLGEATVLFLPVLRESRRSVVKMVRMLSRSAK